MLCVEVSQKILMRKMNVRLRELFLLYVFFWVIPWRLNFICRRLGTLCLFHLHRQVPAYEDETECSETSAYKIQMPGNCPEENIHHTEQGDSLKSRSFLSVCLSVCLSAYLRDCFIPGTATPISMKCCVADLLKKLSRTVNVDSFSGIITSVLHTAVVEY